MKPLLALTIVAGALALLSGCGQPGPLTMPKPPTKAPAKPAPPAPAPALPSAVTPSSY